MDIFTESIKGFITGITAKLDNLLSSIANIPTLIIDGLKSLLEYLFLPKGNHFDFISNIINSKFPIINQIKSLMPNLFEFATDDMPVFNITLFGATASIIDFRPFADYRFFIHSIIIAVSYYRFLVRLIRRLPNLIGGFY